jgi:hypothetical protein
MNRTLQQLKESVEKLIEQQGADASCAAFIFTKEDVYDDNGFYFSEEITKKVLNDLNKTDSILEKAFGCLEDYINENTK